jgi:hypothetical protein
MFGRRSNDDANKLFNQVLSGNDLTVELGVSKNLDCVRFIATEFNSGGDGGGPQLRTCWQRKASSIDDADFATIQGLS